MKEYQANQWNKLHVNCKHVCVWLDNNILFCLQHPSMAVVKGAGLVMKAIIEVGFKVIHKTIMHVHCIWNCKHAKS